MIEAGAAFGSGGHPTTALLLWMLARLPENPAPACVLEVGCGSGILAVAAALKWRVPIIATDIAPEAVAQTQANAETNGVGELITTLRADGCKHSEIAAQAPYDLIVSNILADLHIRHAADFARLLAPGGRLLLSGILQWRGAELLSYYEQLGLVSEEEQKDGDWVGLLLKRRDI